MPSAGIMASSVVIATCTEVVRDPMDGFVRFVASATPPTLVAARNGFGHQVTSLASSAYTLPVADEWVMVGFAFKVPSVASGFVQMIQLASPIQPESELIVATTGFVRWRRTAGSVTLADSVPGVIVGGTWHYVEIYSRLHVTAGSAIVRVDGVERINVTGVNSKSTSSAAYTSVVFKAGTGTNDIIDDVYVKTGAGCPFNGDTTVASDYGAEQRVTIAGVPDTNGGQSEVGNRFRIARTGRIAKVRYYRRSTNPVLSANVFDSGGTKLAGPAAGVTGADGYVDVTLPTPVPVLAGGLYTVSVGGTGVSWKAGALTTITNTTDCTLEVATVTTASPGSYPGGAGTGTFYVVPVFEPAL